MKTIYAMGVYSLLFSGIMVWSFSSLKAQGPYPESKEKKYIEVTGSAEMMVKPNFIELEIVLTENYPSQKSGQMEKIEKEFYKILNQNNIDSSDVIINNYSHGWYWWYWWNYRHHSHIDKTFKLKLSSNTDFLQLLKDLDQPYTKSIRISQTSHDEIQRFRKEVKMEAMKAAKEKATYLLESVNEKPGGLLFVEEIPQSQQNYYYNYRQQNLLSNAVVDYSPSHQGGEVSNVSQIKLRYEIKARFEIK